MVPNPMGHYMLLQLQDFYFFKYENTILIFDILKFPLVLEFCTQSVIKK